MPTPVKHIFFFRSAEGYGFSETHYRLINDSALNLQTIANAATANIVPQRVALLGRDVDFIGLRVSYPIENDVASYNTDENIGSGNDQAGMASALSVVVTFVNSTFTKKSITHLRGSWDALERDEAFNPPPDVAAIFTPLFVAWKAALIADGYGWLTKRAASSAKGIINSYLVNTDGTVTFTITANANVTALIGKNAMFRFARINNSKSTLNRALVCNVVDATTLTTTAPIAAGDFSGKGTYIYRDTVFVAYSNTGGLKIGKRQMGKPIGLSVARLKNRARV